MPLTFPNPPALVRPAGPWDAPTALRLWHLASLDAPTVALVWSLAFAWVARVRLPLWVPTLLVLGVWAVYVGDRLLDARAGYGSAGLDLLRERHRFHWRHRRILLPAAVAAACAAAFIVFHLMPTPARERNSVLAAAALVYFTRVHSGIERPGRPHRFLTLFLTPFLTKEFLVGLLFAAGCVLPAFSRAVLQPLPILWPLLVSAACFALLAGLNCSSIESWESQPGGRSAIPAKAALLALAGVLLAALLVSLQPRAAGLLAAGAASALLLGLLDRIRPRLTPIALRACADLVLLTPALLLLIRR